MANGGKQITIYEPNAQGTIIKKVGTSYENAEVIDGEVVNEGFENAENLFSAFFSFFGNKHNAPNPAQKRSESWGDGNGREFNPETGNLEYTAEANGNADPYATTYDPQSDYQGTVPNWDGYMGE